MDEEQRPFGGHNEQAPEQVTAPVNLESTRAIEHYPPPTGSPFVHESPPTAERLPTAQDPTVSAQAHGASPPAAGGRDQDGPGGPGRRQGLGARAITAMVAGALATAMVAALFGGMAGAYLVSRGDGGNASLPSTPAGSTSRPSGSIADIAARVLPSVVTIQVAGPSVAGTGSGFVMRKDGYILTNNHVVDAATAKGKIIVIFSDGKRADATVVGRDESYDLAVIRVDRRNLPVLVLGASKAVVVGDPVIAVGAPLGLDSTVTSGIVSALNRPVTAGGQGASSASFINAIQTDAAINPGNAGGPLLDMSGRVIGVNSAIARVASSQGIGGQSGNIGVGFAIPSDQVRTTAEQLISSGKSTHPVIGVMLDTAYEGEGVKVASAPKNGSLPITKGGPADRAGVRPGDVITKFEGRPVIGADEFVVAIRARSVGDKVVLTVRRGGAERNVNVTLQADG